MLLARLLSHLVRFGRLSMIDAHGKRHVFGTDPAPKATIRLHDKALHTRLLVNPRLVVGEAYMDGTLTIEEGSLYDFLSIVMGSVMRVPKHGLFALALHGADWWLKPFQQNNFPARSRENVGRHYDLSGALYDLFLDRDRQYSCGYFEHPHDDLETAQAAKKRHVASKLLLKPGQKVLDIGCGWGGMGLYLAREAGVDVTGLTLSQEQVKVANERALDSDLADQTRFLMRDYREEQGRFDRIVSVGMFEHVGITHFQAYFDKISALLKDDGVALLHAIGRADGPRTTNPWLRKHIFPGGYCPALSEVLPAIERAGLWVTDIEILRLHYADTLMHWRRRFMANRDHVKTLYDERFCRMWEFYLAGCEAGFRVQGLMVFQIQLSKKIDTVPVTRDYIAAWKQAHPLPPLAGQLADVAD